jgi:hypothetical protein
MALSGKSSGKNLFFSLDLQGGATPTDISTYCRKVDGLPGDVEQGDVTAGGGALGYAWLPGLIKAGFSAEFVFDDAANSAWTIMKNFMRDTTTRSFVYGPAGSTSGYAKVSGECRIAKITPTPKPTDPLLFTVDFVVDGIPTIGTF